MHVNHLTCAITGTELYANVPERWHITVFHTSKFDDTRPNPLEALTPDLQETESGCRPLPSAQALQCEQQTIQEVVRQNQPLHLEVSSFMSIFLRMYLFLAGLSSGMHSFPIAAYAIT